MNLIMEYIFAPVVIVHLDQNETPIADGFSAQANLLAEHATRLAQEHADRLYKPVRLVDLTGADHFRCTTLAAATPPPATPTEPLPARHYNRFYKDSCLATILRLINANPRGIRYRDLTRLSGISGQHLSSILYELRRSGLIRPATGRGINAVPIAYPRIPPEQPIPDHQRIAARGAAP